jgi:hypothetical protein
MLALFLTALSAAAQDHTDGFGRRVCGIEDINADGTDDLVVADAGYGDRGAIWTISGKDGHRIGTALGERERAWLGGSFFVMGGEICACVDTPEGPALQYRPGKTLEPTRASDVVRMEKGFYAWVECAGDNDGDGVLDAALCVVPNKNEGCFIEIVSGKTGRQLRRIAVALSRSNYASAVASLGDLDGDGVPEIGAGTGYSFPEDQRFRVFVFSGKTGEKLSELLGHDGQYGFGAALGAVGDLDGDGVNEIALVDDAEGAIRVFSGKKRQFSHALQGSWEGQGRTMEMGNVTTLRDLDGDGMRDFALTIDTFPGGQARIYSGKQGTSIRNHGAESFSANDGYPAFVADVGDLDHDGRGDYAVGTSHHLAGGGTSSVTAFSGASGKPLFVIDERKLTAP